MTYGYSQPITAPKNMREGLQNFVQMVINKIEAGDAREAVLSAVDLLEDLRCGIYDTAITDTGAHERMAAEIRKQQQAHSTEIIAAVERGIEQGIAQERARIAATLGIAA